MDKLQLNSTPMPLLEPPSKDSDTPRQILHVLFKHKRSITLTFLVVSLPVLITTFLRPTRYLAAAKVLIKPSRAYLVSPIAGESKLDVPPSPEMINSEIQIIKSREVLQRLVTEIPNPQQESTNGSKDNGAVDIKGRVLAMEKYLEVSPIPASNIIQISLTSEHPEWVAKVVNRAAELYLDQHLKVHKTQGVGQFYDEQDKKLQSELLKAEKALKEYQEKEGIVDVGQEVTSNLGALATFERNLKETESAIRETEERIAILTAQLKEQRQNVQTGATASTSPVYNKIRDRLVQLELERNNLLLRYTPKDRLVMDKQKEIAELKERLSEEVRKMVGSESASLNSIHDGILNSLLGARVQLQGLKERRNTLMKQVAAYSSVAAEKKRKSYEYDRLQQEVNAKKEALGLYKKKAEEARISEAMDERKFGNASILERATPPLQRAGFSPWITVLATILISIAVAVAGAFAIEFFNTTLKDEADVEGKIGLPVLATIQYSRS
jgi:uncharacterized protein involved in exopolysaccharide biosynthesis